MTKEEAKTKVCPTRCGWDITDAGNHEVEACCIASDCMMWKWGISPEDAAEINARGNAGAVPYGHCGLAK